MISRRQSILLLLALVGSSGLSFERALAVTSQDIPIVVLAGSDQQQPTISNNWIAWQDRRPANGVYGVRAENRSGGPEFWVSPSPGSAYYSRPRLSDDTIIFPGNPGSKGTMFYDNLADPTPAQKVYNQATNQFHGDVHDNLVVWQDVADSSSFYGDLYGSYIGSNSKFPISTTGNVHIFSATDGRFVVWHELNGSNQLDLWSKDLQTGISTMLQSGTGPDAEIDNGIVVYEGGGGVGIRNLLTNQAFTIPAPPVASVAISGDLVVFSVIPSGNGGYSDLWGARLSNPQPFVISNAPGDQLWPDVAGNFVVWSDSRGGDFDIYGAFVPEPGTMALVACGLACSLFVRRRP